MLIAPTDYLTLMDDISGVWGDTQPGIDRACTRAQAMIADVDSAFASNVSQKIAWEGIIAALYQASTGATGATGVLSTLALSGVTSFSTGTSTSQGALTRAQDVQAMLSSWFDVVRARLRYEAAQDGISGSVQDIPTYAAYYNGAGGAPYTVLHRPALAALYWMANHAGTTMLDPSAVMAPPGIDLAIMTITGATTAALSANASTNLPTANNYATYKGVYAAGTAYSVYDEVLYSGDRYLALAASTGVTPGTDPTKWFKLTQTLAPSYQGPWYVGTAYTTNQVVNHNMSWWVAVAGSTGVEPGTNPLAWVPYYWSSLGADGNLVRTYPGGVPMAQGFTAPLHLQYLVTTTVNGTCAATFTGDGVDSTGAAFVGHTATATLDNLTAGSSGAPTPTNAGDRFKSFTGVSFTGTATAGVVHLQTGALER